MAIENKTKSIGNSVYSINTYKTSDSVRFLTRLTKVVGKSFAALIGSEEEDANIFKAIDLLVDNLDKDDVSQLIEQMIKAAQTMKDNKELHYETDFAGDSVGDLFQVLMFIVQENYSKVFPVGAIQG